MMARNGDIYFLIRVLEKGAHMNQNYPNYILKKIRQFNGLTAKDTSRDAEFQELAPEEAFDQVLQFDGIIGYRYTILRWIAEIFKVKLDVEGDTQSKEDFVQGLGNIFRAQDRDDQVVAMRMDDAGNVTVFYANGSTRSTSLGDKVGIMADAEEKVF
jgi:hypothetical protein